MDLDTPAHLIVVPTLPLIAAEEECGRSEARNDRAYKELFQYNHVCVSIAGDYSHDGIGAVAPYAMAMVLGSNEAIQPGQIRYYAEGNTLAEQMFVAAEVAEGLKRTKVGLQTVSLVCDPSQMVRASTLLLAALKSNLSEAVTFRLLHAPRPRVKQHFPEFGLEWARLK